MLLATCPNASIRQGNRAIEAAERACELTKGADWSSCVALAAAYAEAGKFANAVETAKKAAQLAPEEQRNACLQYAKQFEANQPLRVGAL